MNDTLDHDDTPMFFDATAQTELDHSTPDTELGQSQRTRVRSIAGMQKEALVTSSHTGRTWRLVSDEGDYLDGDDVAPAPLGFLATGMASSFLAEIQALADDRGVALRDPSVVLDNYYTMNGSALRGTMTGGALPVDVEVTADTDTTGGELDELVDDALRLSPIYDLLTREHESAFSLTCNGDSLEPTDVAALDGGPLPDPKDTFDALDRNVQEHADPLMVRTGRKTEPLPDESDAYQSGEGSSLQETQDRVLHVRGTATAVEDGLQRVEVELFSPIGTVFELLVDNPDGGDRTPEAPDPATYVAAGVGFCFMTQFGRYADITNQSLPAYRIVQDTHFSLGGATAGTGAPGRAAPVETHVFLDTPEGDDFARETLQMAEQTCYLHALCETPLTDVDVTTTTR